MSDPYLGKSDRVTQIHHNLIIKGCWSGKTRVDCGKHVDFQKRGPKKEI